jgi:tetratricopeptide (TPR) repeat protein
MREEDRNWPAPLRSAPTPAGAALREYERVLHTHPDEDAAYARVSARIERSPRRARWPIAAGILALAAPALIWLLRPDRTALPTHARPGTASETVTKPPLPRATAAEPTLRLGSAATPLPPGKLVLEGGIEAALSAGTRATGRLVQGTVDIALASGTLDLQVPPRKPGQAVLITAGQLRFTVVGTALSVRRQGQRVSLNVAEGLVAVSQDGDHVATVATGESWSAPLPPTSPPERVAHARVARLPLPKGCERIPVSRWQERLACYQQEAKKGGPAGERAQHLLARYLRDDVVDLTAALNAFEAQRSRFPRGRLRADADRAIIGLLPRLGRHAEALAESQSFLDAWPAAEDRAEIRLLRGDIYRAIFDDPLRAEREYDEGTEAQGRTGDDSRFLRALCLEALGRVDDARLAYQDYLAQAETAHAREARRRMERLAR